jgi:hypothetical protein
MQSIPFHIAYLLTQHECVIVPGLGAFVVSPFDKAKKGRWGILSPPENFLGFNSEITHNDGLLANSVAKERKCSYEEANLLIAQYVVKMWHSFDKGNIMHVSRVGNLQLIENKLIFQPDRTLSCNAFNYGLTDFSLPLLKDIEQQTGLPKKENKEVVWIPVSRRLIVYAGSVAAALLAMCLIPTPLNNGHISQKTAQYASLFHFSTPNTDNKEATPSITEDQTPADTITSISVKKEQPASEVLKPAKTITTHYYIIVASLPNQVSAKKALTHFQSHGFKNAAILSEDGKYRIYTNRFDDNREAENFLIQFRKNHPAHSAWLLKQKN